MRWTLLSPLLLFAVACTTAAIEPTTMATPALEVMSSPEASATPKTAPQLAMNDVSVLFPLPASATTPGYLKAETVGVGGPLLPRALFDAIPTFPVVPADALQYERLHVVSARFDGCFQTAAGCEAQIRLVMQPINDDGSSRDSALHVFYRLTADELKSVVAGLRSLHALAPEVDGAPLDVHPAFVNQGIAGPYGAGSARCSSVSRETRTSPG